MELSTSKNQTEALQMSKSQPIQKFISVNHEQIPNELKNQNLWCVWKSIPNQKSPGKNKKIPYHPITKKALRVNHPTDWACFQDVLPVYLEGGYSGIGILLTEESEFVGFDLDNCIRNGRTTKTADEIIKRLDSYTERSPTGTGIHIIAKRGKRPLHLEGNKIDGIEIYWKNQFFTVTGVTLNDSLLSIRRCPKDIKEVHQEFIGNRQFSANNEKPVHSNAGDDTPISGDLFPGQRDTSPSGKDFALCRKLASQGLDAPEIKKRLLADGENREKYSRDDYVDLTIQRAMDGVKTHYTPSLSWKDLPSIDHRAVVNEEFQEPVWLVKNWIRKDTYVGQVVGGQQTGKSFLLTTLSYCLASGRSYGPFTIPEPRRVLYLNVEDPRDQIKRRAMVILKELAFTNEEQDLIDLNLIILPWMGQFGTLSDTNGVTTESYSILEQAIADFKPDLVIGDTKSRLSGLEENSNDAQAALVRLLEQLVVKYCCVFLMAHHPNKSDPYSSRGGGAWESNIRFTMSLIPDGQKKGRGSRPGSQIASSRCYKVITSDNYGGCVEAYFQKDPETGFPHPEHRGEDFFRAVQDWLFQSLKEHGPVNKRTLMQNRPGEDSSVAAMLATFPDGTFEKKKAIETAVAALIEDGRIYEVQKGKARMLTTKKPTGKLGETMRARAVRRKRI